MKFIVRRLKESDESFLFQLRISLDKESEFMLYDQDERINCSLKERDTIKLIKSNGSELFGAFIDGRMVGILELIRGYQNRIRHSAYIVIGVLKEFSGFGIGLNLLLTAEKWAVMNGISRIELSVMTHNERALGLYKRMGFEIEGVRKKAIKIKNDYYDEFYMAKLFL